MKSKSARTMVHIDFRTFIILFNGDLIVFTSQNYSFLSQHFKFGQKYFELQKFPTSQNLCPSLYMHICHYTTRFKMNEPYHDCRQKTVWKKQKFSLTREMIRQINAQYDALVTKLISRNFWSKNHQSKIPLFPYCAMAQHTSFT